MDVKIGIADSGREISLKTEMSRDEVQARVEAALTAEGGAVLELDDEKGRRHLVPAARIAYVEIGEQSRRPVGFLSA